jgi:hypothetical protein
MQVQLPAPPRALRTVTHPAIKTVSSIDLYQVTPGPRHRLRIISAAMYSVYVHQSARRPLPCYGSTDEECEHHRLPLQRQHYLYVVEIGRTRLRLLRLTNGLVYEVMPSLCEAEKNLAGLVIEVWRAHKDRNDSPMLGTFVDDEAVEVLDLSPPPIEWAVTRMLTAPPRLQPWRPSRSSFQTAPTTSSPVPTAGPYPGYLKDQIRLGKLTCEGNQAGIDALLAEIAEKTAAHGTTAGK